MSLSACLRPSARGAAFLALAALVGLALPRAASASLPPAAQPPAAGASNVLTLYSEPGLKGRQATYRASALDIERQGFVARSAASTGMWTLCEGAQVASRCQTVNGEAPELKLSPEIVRPGLNAVALYSLPGFKGDRIVYSFPADRPAPFHARSARTWGGGWSLCDRGFKGCQTIDGRMQDIDLVVAAVRPAPPEETATVLTAPKPHATPAHPSLAEVRTVHSSYQPHPTPIAVHHTAPRAAPLAVHKPRLVHAAIEHPRPAHPAAPSRRPTHAWPSRIVHQRLFTEVRERPRAHRSEAARRLHELRPVRFEHVQHSRPHARLVRQVADRHARRTHAVRRRLYRRVRMFWGGDPYLYAAEPRFWGPPPPW